MGLFSFFKKQDDKAFLSPEVFEEKSAIQVNMSPLVMDKLRDLDVSEYQELKLEFFFYTNTDQKAQALAQELANMDYEAAYGTSAGRKNLFIITGWTTKMRMDDDVVVAWTKQMCDLGYSFDCEFDGWGTTPDQ